MTDPDHPFLRRRTLLRSAGGGAVAASLLVACGSDDEPSASGDSGDSEDAADGGSGGGHSGHNGHGGQGGQQLASTSEIDVGGGVIVDEKYVVTQPSSGEFKAFSAICTHQGCVLASVADNTISCNCHGSAFSAEDGSVINGPAETPLGEEQITVEGNKILLG
jgi:Rieske Fe-S protein